MVTTYGITSAAGYYENTVQQKKKVRSRQKIILLQSRQ